LIPPPEQKQNLITAQTNIWCGWNFFSSLQW